MIFQRTLLREFAITGIGTLLVLLAITVTTQFIRFLGYAARGSISTDAVVTFLGLAGLRYLPILLSLALFVSILLSLSRAYRDSEMVVWFTSGQGLLSWIRPTLLYALPLVFTIGLLSLLLTPWATGKAEEYRRLLESREDVSAISPGIFKESKRGDRVFFVEKLTMDLSVVANIFVYSEEEQETGVTVAARGFTETSPNGSRYLVLEDGRRYVGPPGTAEYKIIEFEKYGVRLEEKAQQTYLPSIRSRPTNELLQERNPETDAELVWRVGMPLSALALSMLAIPLSFVNPRAGRSVNLMLAAFAYLLYNNSLSIVQTWVSQEKVTFAVGLLGPHLLTFAIVAFLFYRRVAVSSLFSKLRRMRA
ncbi:MAG: LPS export ABC transporter permease LptF [Betaproteobacteria bacterium SG8_40]|nr:MAG: LPS export ABC transporter permease LptF [Betaproteobacteria bacterium SG8_40]